MLTSWRIAKKGIGTEKGFIKRYNSEIRVGEINNHPKIALDFGPDSRRTKGSIAALCDPLCNNQAGAKDKQDWMIINFPGPNTQKPILVI
ncbi:MAG: hypothetical protein P8163_11120 [Candidatus Thiodiazotropha sp.]